MFTLNLSLRVQRPVRQHISPLVIYKNQIKCKTIFQYFYSNWCFVKAAEDASKKQIKSTADQQQQQRK